ncbi:MAG: hypothetical protein ABJE95_05290 [Byssovorax sp.]
MRRTGYFRALPALAVLATASISARAEVPQSHVVAPKEDRQSPRERELQEADARRKVDKAIPGGRWVTAHREARRQRTVGIVFTSIGGFFTPVGALVLIDGKGKPGGGLTGWGSVIGGTILGIGATSLVIGIPMLVTGISESQARLVPTVQVGPRSAGLTWSF